MCPERSWTCLFPLSGRIRRPNEPNTPTLEHFLHSSPPSPLPCRRAYQALPVAGFRRSGRRLCFVRSACGSDRGDVASLNLLYGPGGKEHQPSGKFTFVKEDKQGTSPKFEVVDEQGVHWKAKLGDETKSETAATRLVWAAGYFTDEDYYLPELRVEKMPKLSRGREFVSAGRRRPRRPAGAQHQGAKEKRKLELVQESLRRERKS